MIPQWRQYGGLCFRRAMTPSRVSAFRILRLFARPDLSYRPRMKFETAAFGTPARRITVATEMPEDKSFCPRGYSV